MSRILVVEDEAITAKNITGKLKSAGYIIVGETAFGEEAIEKAGELRPDLVLMDIGLAGAVDGITAAEQIRRQFDIPVVYLTAFTSNDTLQRAKVTEPFGYLVKPFQAKELYSTVEIALYKHRIDQQLREREAELAAVFNSASVLMILVDGAQQVRKVNRATEKAVNRPPEEMIGLRGGEALRCMNALKSPQGCGFGPDCKNCAVRRTVLDTLATGNSHYHVEATLPLVKNEKSQARNLLVSTTPLEVTGEKLVLICIDDITEQHQTEARLKKTEINYRTVADFNADWEIWQDGDGALRYVSPSCEDITGYPVQAFLDNPDLLREIILPEDQALWDDHTRDTRAVQRRYQLQYRIRRRDGQIRWIEHVCQPVNDEQAGFLGYRASNRDITMRKQAEQGLQDSVQKLRNAYEQATVYAQDLKQQIADRRQAQAEIEKLNAELEQRIADRTWELSALYDITAVASTAIDLDPLLTQLLKRVLRAMRSEMGYIHLLAEIDDQDKDRQLHLAVQQGLPGDRLAQIDPIAVGQGLAGWVIAHEELLVVPDVTTDSRAIEFTPGGRLVYLGAPVRAGGTVLGTLSVLSEEKLFTAEEVALLASVADQIGVTVESARLRRQAEQAAVLAERERLARDLHDAVTQSLYSLTLFADTGLRLVETGEPDPLRHNLTRISQVAQQALKEMRLLIHELKPLDLSRGLAGALHHRLNAVESRANLKTKFVADDTIKLPVVVEEGLYHIAQEALNNALRHAHATEIAVHLRRANGVVELEIIDNGIGFNPQAAANGGGMGLANMQHRVDRLGGALSITAEPQQGTQVKVTVDAL